MTTLENKLAELLLETAIRKVEDAGIVHVLVTSYSTLISAANSNYAWRRNDDKDICGKTCTNTEATPTLDVEKTTVAELCSVVNAITTPAEDKPTRTRRTKAQIEADKAEAEKAADAAAGVEPQPPEAVDSEVEDLKTPQEPEAEEVQIDDVETEAPKITHGKIQELFTLKSTNIAKAGGDVSGFKARLREMLAEFGSPAGISKLPEANLAAFHAKLVNLT